LSSRKQSFAAQQQITIAPSIAIARGVLLRPRNIALQTSALKTFNPPADRTLMQQEWPDGSQSSFIPNRISVI
jgi:hypothetical protein